jgi:hypothetical protein
MIDQLRLARTYSLPPKLCGMLILLIEKETVTADMIEHDQQLATCAKVGIWRLRRRLKPHKIEIKAMPTVGYWLEQKTKDQIIEAVA